MSLGWLVTLEAEVPASDDFLVAEELEVLAKLRVDKRRREWRHGRWTAKRALALAWQREGSSATPGWLVRAAPDGAPEACFADGARAPFSLSLSHSAGLAMAAVASRDVPELGCDVERVEPRSEELVRQFYTDAERALLAQWPAEAPLLACLVWSAKESVLKALRTGLRSDTRSVSVSVEPVEDRATWQPFQARHAPSGRVFRGLWRTRAGWVLTLIGAEADGAWELEAR